nr:hypothetical protein [Deltaproteobacteria bacterium]
MNTRFALSLRLALLAPLLVQCSLTVGGFEIPTCRLQSDCEVLNTEGHIAADACARYACSATSHQCVLTSDGDGDGEARAGCGGNDCDDTPGLGILRTHGRAEDPDGVDNNCNTIIDEGVWISPSQDLGASTGVPATLSAARRSPAAGGLAVMTTDAASGAALGFVTDGAPAAMPVTWRTVYTESERSVAMPGWPTGTPDAPSVGGGARFADLVAQPLSDTLWIAATVNNAGCGPGRLYVATFDPAQRALTLDFRRAPRGASNLALGVGAIAPACDPGASRPAIAVASAAGQPDRALVLWQSRAADERAPGCNVPSPLLGLGAWVAPQTDPDVPVLSRVQGIHGGAPSPLTAAVGSTSRPAVAALTDGGFVVAYGVAGGGVELRVVPTFEATEAATLDLTRSRLLVRVGSTASANVDQVALALGGVRDGRQEIGLAWKEGCDPNGALQFARVQLDPANPAASMVNAATLRVTQADAPALAYVDAGILQNGGSFGGATVRDIDDGGWVLAWIDRSASEAHVRALRVSELTGSVLEIPAGGGCACATTELPGDIATLQGALGRSRCSAETMAPPGCSARRWLMRPAGEVPRWCPDDR